MHALYTKPPLLTCTSRHTVSVTVYITDNYRPTARLACRLDWSMGDMNSVFPAQLRIFAILAILNDR